MKTKSELEQLLENTKALVTRAEAAEAKQEEEKAAAIKGYNAPISGNRSNSDENRTLAYFGVKSAKDLLKVNVADPKFERVPEELKHLALNFKKTVNTGRFITQMFNGDAKDFIGDTEAMDRPGNCKGILTTRFGKEVLAPAVKAFGSTVSGGGDEWVPTAVANSYIAEYELDHVLESRFTQVNMPSQPFDMPTLGGLTKARVVAENTSATNNNFTTSKVTLSANKLVEYYILPEELTEDSAPDFLRAGQDEVVKAQVRAFEDAILNGDADGSHQDAIIQAAGADHAAKFYDGLRKLALNNPSQASLSFAGGQVTEAYLRQLRALMGKLGVDPKQLMWIAGPTVLQQLLALPSVATLDKFGPQATVLQGALAAYQGIPILTSEFMIEDLNASGVNDATAANNNFAGLLLVHRPRFYVGERRAIRVKLMPDLVNQDRWLLASYRRVAFKGQVQSAKEKGVVYGYNIAK